MFAPVLNNIGPSLVQSGFQNAAGMKLDGAQALAAGIQSAGQSLGGGIGAALEGVQAKAAKYSQAAGQMDAMRAYGDQYGMDTSFLNGIEQKYAKDPDKLLGALSVVGSAFDRSAQMYAQQQQYNGALELARQKAALGGGRSGSGGGSSAPMFGVQVDPSVKLY